MPVSLNVLDISRTFVDKLMSVKRHAICGSLIFKERHIYDVTRLCALPEIRCFLEDKAELKRLIRLTKETDSYYLEKRGISKEYDPTGLYDFNGWRAYLNDDIRKAYGSLHKELLYTDEKQDFDDALRVFEEIDGILRDIGD